MSWFEYEGLTQGGTAIAGRIESPSNEAAREDLLRMGVELHELSVSSPPPTRPARLSDDDLLFFNEQLASLAQAGMAPDEGLEQLGRDLQSPRLKIWVQDIVMDMRRGVPIDQAISSRQGGLPLLYGRVVHAGIAAGELPATLLNLNQHLRLTGNTRRMMWEVIGYPLIVILIALTLASTILLFVLPQFEDIFKDFGTQLPAMTLLLMSFADWFGKGTPPGWMILWAVPLIMSLGWHLRYSESGRGIRESVVFAMPVLGRVHKASLVARFLRSVATAVASHIPLPQAIRLSADATGSSLLQRDAEWLAGEVERGHSVFVANQTTRVIPPLFGFCVQVAVGREELPKAIATLSRSYENRALHSQSMIRAFLLPALVILVGVVLGFVIVAMFLPLVHLINSVSSGS